MTDASVGLMGPLGGLLEMNENDDSSFSSLFEEALEDMTPEQEELLFQLMAELSLPDTRTIEGAHTHVTLTGTSVTPEAEPPVVLDTITIKGIIGQLMDIAENSVAGYSTLVVRRNQEIHSVSGILDIEVAYCVPNIETQTMDIIENPNDEQIMSGDVITYVIL